MSADATAGPALAMLVVGDSAAGARLLERTLGDAGLPARARRVHDEAGLRQVLEAARWDLVVCDPELAAFDAIEALHIVAAHDVALPIILVAASAAEDEVVEAMHAGAWNFVSKDRLSRLAPIVRRALEEAAVRREHQTGQEELRRLAAIVESSQDAIISKDLGGLVTSWNRGAERLYGWTAAETVGRSLASILPDPHRREEAEILELVNAGESLPAYETRRVAKDGSVRHVSLTVSPIYAGGELVGISSIARDITEQREVEEALRRSETRYRMLLEHLPDALVVFFDTELRIVFAAGPLLDCIGWASDEVLGARVSEFLPADAAWPLEDGFRSALAGRPATLEMDGLRNPELVMSYRTVPVHAEDGTIVGGMALGRDVSVARRSEGELRAARELFEGAFANAPVGMAIVDAEQGSRYEGTFIRVNRAFADIVGIPEQELMGVSPTELTHPEDRPESEAGFARMLSGELEEHVAYKRYVRRDGGIRWVQVRARLVHDSAGRPRHALGVVADVTAKVEAERESQRLEAMLRQSQKLEGIGQLAGGIAHDFNNLLAVILNYATLARSPELMDEALTEISRAAQRAADLTSQLLVFSRQEVAQPVVLDLNAMVDETRNFLVRTIGEDITLSTELEEAELPVRADRGQLEHTLMNLAVNARDAMPDGGRLEIRTRAVELSEAEARPLALASGRYAEIRVADTGVGMTPDVLERVFEPFYTTKEKGRGTGLGLAMIYGIATEAGGAVSIDSEPGAGTTVRVLLPREDAAVDRDQGETEVDVPPARGRRVLVAEDEEAVRRLIVRILSGHGYSVVAAANGHEALQLASSSTPIDTLLTDVVMPGMPGTTLADRLLAATPGLNVVFMTGYTDRPAQIPADAPVVLKPFTAAELLRQVGVAKTAGG